MSDWMLPKIPDVQLWKNLKCNKKATCKFLQVKKEAKNPPSLMKSTIFSQPKSFYREVSRPEDLVSG